MGPVYAGRLPKVMEDYIQKVQFEGTSKAYFIATCAQTPWQTVNYVKKLCAKKDFSLLGFQSVVMPQGYVAGGGTQPQEVNKKILKEAEPKIQKIAETIRGQTDSSKGKARQCSDCQNLSIPLMYSLMISAKGFTVTEKCIGCGKCEQRCPMNNVKLKNNMPVWGTECTHCMACIGRLSGEKP